MTRGRSGWKLDRTLAVDQVTEQWSAHLAYDPAYSPNLSLEADSFTLARSPRVTPPWR